jgi:two-component system, chemotaxis family, protein-glutamate methylesterase/glutaminase
VQGGRLELDRGPKQNGVRPAVDPLFRTAAAAYRERAIAVVLSGALSDGAGGAAAIAAAGGAVLVQDPRDAVVPSMPESALAAVPAAVRMSATELAAEIARRAAQFPESAAEERSMASHETAGPPAHGRRPDGPPAALTCPECHGPLWELREGKVVRYRCRVGHSFYEDALIDGNGSAVESALWMALEALDERAELLGKLADRLERAGRDKSAARYREQARGAAERAELVRGVLIVDDDPVTPVVERTA